MTSYPGRIKNVGIAIFLLLEQQTLPPDEVHLWLAAPQFPNKEADLPEDLQKVIKHPKVKLHWLPENMGFEWAGRIFTFYYLKPFLNSKYAFYY